MPSPILYVAITNHGFGHATRTASVVAELKRRCPELLVIMATTAPRWLMESYIPDEFIHRQVALDIGVVQRDSLQMDLPETLAQLQRIRQKANQLIANEVSFIQQNQVSLILADIPPLACAIAHHAQIPCWAISNFGWDFIYRAWGGKFADEFVEMADWIATQFNQCDRLFRLPFHEPMGAFPTITDIGLTGGTPKFALADLRQKFAITTPPERTTLLTFGGLGLEQIPYHNLARFPDWQFITFDRQAPDLPNLINVGDRQYRPVDFMPLCERVVSKPGFSTFAEACRTDTAIVTMTRADFAEAAILLAGIQDHQPHQVMEPAEFFQGDWGFLRQPVLPPRTGQRVGCDGNGAIAAEVFGYLS
jgi:hypothetical protein